MSPSAWAAPCTPGSRVVRALRPLDRPGGDGEFDDERVIVGYQIFAGFQSGGSTRTICLRRLAARLIPSTEFTRVSSCSILSVPSYPTERSVYTKSAQNVAPPGCPSPSVT